MVRKPKSVDQEPAVDQHPSAETPEPVAIEPEQPEVPAQRGPDSGADLPKQGPSSGKSFTMGAGLGIVAAALGYAAALQFPLPLAGAAPSVDLSQMTARLDALESQAAPAIDPTIITRLTALETAATPDLTALEARLAALETQIAAKSPAPDLRAELAAIKQQLAQSNPEPAIKAAIAAEMASVQQAAQQMQAAVEQAAQKASLQSALTQLRAAMDTGAPYASVLDTMELPDALRAHAETGIPSLTALRDEFPSAARAGLEAALRSDMGATWGERLTNFLRNQTGARSLTPQTGDSPDAVLSRIEAGLRAADMGAVMTEAALLPEDAKLAMAGWLGKAQQRADALAALKTLSDKGQN